jgi:hypothetical protein
MAPERVMFIRGILSEPEDVLDGDVRMHSVERSPLAGRGSESNRLVPASTVVEVFGRHPSIDLTNDSLDPAVERRAIERLGSPCTRRATDS